MHDKLADNNADPWALMKTPKKNLWTRIWRALFLKIKNSLREFAVEWRAVENPWTLRCSVALLDERYFGELCFYSDVKDALTRNKAALLDAHAFGEAFDASLEAMDAWKTVRQD